VGLLVSDIPIKKGLLTEVIDTIKLGQDVTCVSLPRSFRTSFASQLQNPAQDLIDFTGEDFFKETIFIIVDLSLELDILKELLDQNIGQYSNEESLVKKLRSIVDSGKRVVFIVDNFSFNSSESLKYLINLSLLNTKRIGFLFLTLYSDFYLNENVEKTVSPQFYRNIFRIPYLDKEETFEWIDAKSSQVKIKVNNENKQKIWEFSGGIPLIISHFVRLLARYSTVDEILLLNETKEKLSSLWNSFVDEEKSVIRLPSLAAQNNESREILNSFIEMGVFSKDNNLIGSWLKLLNVSPNLISIDKGDITIGGMSVNSKLTGTELKILTELQVNKKISRDEIAKSIWGDYAKASFSDYAIDQAMSRLRKKLTSLGFSADYIKTIKRFGFQITQ